MGLNKIYKKFSENTGLIDYVLFGLTIVYFGCYIFKLYSSLENTLFWSDENVHAYISSVILKTKSLPAVLPDDIYGGYEYSYPPLFHILSAMVMAVAGFPALKFVNLVLLIFFLAAFYVLIKKFYDNSAALLAILLISLSMTLAVSSIRFMTEMLSMLLVFFSFFFLVAAIKKSNRSDAIISGVSTGLLLLSKQLGIVVLGFYFLLLIWFFLKHRQDFRLLLYVIATAACIFAPYFIWSVYNRLEVFGFLSIFFGTEAEWATAAVKSFRRYDSSFKEFALLFHAGNGNVITVSFLIPLFHFIRTRAKDRPHNYIFLMTIYLAAVMCVWHITHYRHTITLLPLVIFSCVYAFHHLVTNKIAIRAAIILLLVFAGIHAYNMPDYRQSHNPHPEVLDVIAVVEKDHNSDGRTLVIQAFDFFMYTRKPVIWPFSNLKTPPLNLFAKQPADNLYALLKQYDIDFVLIDMRFVVNTDDFFGRNFPIPFVRNCEKLDKQGKLSLKAISDSKNFILLRVI